METQLVVTSPELILCTECCKIGESSQEIKYQQHINRPLLFLVQAKTVYCVRLFGSVQNYQASQGLWSCESAITQF